MWPLEPQSHRIRKGAGDLTPADYERYPVWEFALDEEGIKGQDESTVRPLHPIVWPSAFDCIVGASITASAGERYPGAVSVNSFTIREVATPADLDVWVLMKGEQVDFRLAAEHWEPDDKARIKIAAVYASLGTDATRLFPLTVRPYVSVPGLPEAWQVPGFMRAPHAFNRNPFLR